MAKEYAKGFYTSAAWRRVQAAYMESKCYLCERCGRPARVVHHKIYITPQNINDPNITLNFDNLESLCQDCHTNEHLGKGEPIASGLQFTESGDIIPK